MLLLNTQHLWALNVLKWRKSGWVLLCFYSICFKWQYRPPPIYGTELGSLTTANFCFFTWKITNILSDSDWNQCTYFFHLSTSLDLTMRDTAHQKTWHFKKKHKKIKKLSIRSAENSSWWNVKELCIDAVFFTLIRLWNRFTTKKFLSDIICCTSSYWWG